MNNLKDKVDSLCMQFFDDGEDEESRESVKQLENAGYKISYALTSGASALMVDGYEAAGRTAISRLVKQLIKCKEEK